MQYRSALRKAGARLPGSELIEAGLEAVLQTILATEREDKPDTDGSDIAKETLKRLVRSRPEATVTDPHTNSCCGPRGAVARTESAGQVD